MARCEAIILLISALLCLSMVFARELDSEAKWSGCKG